MVAADWVAMDAGTGLVHIAPGHGEEDYELGKQVGLPIYNPVDDDGRFIAEVAHFAGLTVWDANPKIVEHLKATGALVASVPLIHTYPHCWRCKNPTLFRATEQWFIALDKDGLRQRALDAIRNAGRLDPRLGRGAHLQHGRAPPRMGHLAPARLGRADRGLLLHGVQPRSSWRSGWSSTWPTSCATGTGWTSGTRATRRTSCPRAPQCPKCGGTSFRKETDILDVWFDSGCSHAAVLEQRPELRWPAEMYLEGSDQHRGWFHSSLLEAVGTRDEPPYRSVLDPRVRRRRRRPQDVEVARRTTSRPRS